MPDHPTSSNSALTDPYFRRYIGAYALSMTGMMVRVTAMGFLVYKITEDPLKLGIMNFAQVAPEIIFGPVAGAYLDRLDRRKLLIAIQLIYIVGMIALVSLIWADVVQFWHLLLIGVLLGTAASFDWPARMALVPTLVDRSRLQNAVAWNAASFNGSRVVGPSLGGWMIGAVGVAACFSLYALALLPFIAALVTMPVARRPKVEPTEHSPWQGLMEGYRYIWRNHQMRALLSVDVIPIMLGMSYLTMAPAFARDILGSPEQGLGWLLTANGVGSLIGTLVVARMTGAGRRGLRVVLGVLVFGFALIAFGLSGSLWVSLPLVMGVGLVYAQYSTTNDTLIQSTVDEEYRGRVSATYSMIWGLSPVGGLVAGFFATFVGVQWAIALCGMLVLLYVPWLWFGTPLRQID